LFGRFCGENGLGKGFVVDGLRLRERRGGRGGSVLRGVRGRGCI